MFTPVAGEQQPHVQFMIETVAPAFVESFSQQTAPPKHSRLWRRISPRKGMCRRLRYLRGDDLGLVLLAKHTRVATQPFALGMLLEPGDDGCKGSGLVKIVTV